MFRYLPPCRPDGLLANETVAKYLTREDLENIMTPEHYIEWIEIIDGPRSERIRLKPGDAPEALFQLKLKPGVVIREYCNIHGLWVNNL